MKRLITFTLTLGLALTAMAQQRPDYQQTKTAQVLANWSLRVNKSFSVPSGATPGFPNYVADTSKIGALFMKTTTGQPDSLFAYDHVSGTWNYTGASKVPFYGMASTVNDIPVVNSNGELAHNVFLRYFTHPTNATKSYGLVASWRVGGSYLYVNNDTFLPGLFIGIPDTGAIVRQGPSGLLYKDTLKYQVEPPNVGFYSDGTGTTKAAAVLFKDGLRPLQLRYKPSITGAKRLTVNFFDEGDGNLKELAWVGDSPDSITIVNKFVGYYNVLNYGAKRDSTTDLGAVLTAIQAAMPTTGGTIFIPSGKYKQTTQFVTNKPIKIIGDGYQGGLTSFSYAFPIQATTIYYSGVDSAAIKINSFGCKISEIGIKYVGASVAGKTAISSIGGAQLTLDAISSSGFDRGISIENRTFEYSINNVHVENYKTYGMYFDNVSSPDFGDQSVNNCVIHPLDSLSYAAIYIHGGGGVRIIGNKTNVSGSNFQQQKHGIVIDNGSGGTSVLNVSSNSFEGISQQVVLQTSGTTYGYMTFVGNEFRTEGNFTIVELNGSNNSAGHNFTGNNLITASGLSGSHYAFKLSSTTNSTKIGVNTYYNVPDVNKIYDLGGSNEFLDLTAFGTDGSVNFKKDISAAKGNFSNIVASGSEAFRLNNNSGYFAFHDNAGSALRTGYIQFTNFGDISIVAENAIAIKLNGAPVSTNYPITTPQYKLSALNTAPASSTDTGTTGDIRVTAGYIYVCSATDTWVRAPLSTW